MSEYFGEPKSLRGRVKVELDWSNYTTKADFKNATGVDNINNLLAYIKMSKESLTFGDIEIEKN